jgi:hypothetical protein
MKPASSSSSTTESEDFLLRLVDALAREAARRDHDAAELTERTPP